jgi:predicted HAD superfamily phosphohydrolase YqeG
MANLKAVLFDLDDTLVPEMEPEREALLVVCGLAAEKYGADPEAMSNTVGEATEKLWAQ